MFGAVLDGEDDETAACSTASDASGDEDGHQARRSLPARACKTRAETRARAEAEADAEAESGEGARQMTPDPGRAVARRGHATASMEAAGGRATAVESSGQTGRRPAARDSKSSDLDELDGTWDFLFERPHAAESSDPAGPSGARDSHHDRETAVATGRGRRGRGEATSKSSRREVRRPEATRPGQREGRTKPGGQTGRRPAARDSKSSDPEKLDGPWDFLLEAAVGRATAVNSSGLATPGAGFWDFLFAGEEPARAAARVQLEAPVDRPAGRAAENSKQPALTGAAPGGPSRASTGGGQGRPGPGPREARTMPGGQMGRRPAARDSKSSDQDELDGTWDFLFEGPHAAESSDPAGPSGARDSRHDRETAVATGRSRRGRGEATSKSSRREVRRPEATRPGQREGRTKPGGQTGRRPAARSVKSSDPEKLDGTWDFLFEGPHAAESSDPAVPSGARDSRHDREPAAAPGRGRPGRSKTKTKTSRQTAGRATRHARQGRGAGATEGTAQEPDSPRREPTNAAQFTRSPAAAPELDMTKARVKRSRGSRKRRTRGHPDPKAKRRKGKRWDITKAEDPDYVQP